MFSRESKPPSEAEGMAFKHSFAGCDVGGFLVAMLGGFQVAMIMEYTCVFSHDPKRQEGGVRRLTHQRSEKFPASFSSLDVPSCGASNGRPAFISPQQPPPGPPAPDRRDRCRGESPSVLPGSQWTSGPRPAWPCRG
ncbi:unnamed protein product [Arctogadus glacialis]